MNENDGQIVQLGRHCVFGCSYMTDKLSLTFAA